jgi:hypothetical protein
VRGGCDGVQSGSQAYEAFDNKTYLQEAEIAARRLATDRGTDEFFMTVRAGHVVYAALAVSVLKSISYGGFVGA